MRRLNGGFILWVSAAALMMAAVPAHAAKLDDIRKELTARKNEHAALTRKSQAVATDVERVQKELVRASKDIDAQEDRLNTMHKQLENLQLERRVSADALLRANGRFSGLTAGIVRFQQAQAPTALLYSHPLDAVRAEQAMKSVFPALRAQTESFRARIAELKAIEEKITAQRAQRDAEKQELERRQVTLEKLLSERKALYAKTESAREKQQKEVERLAQESRTLEDLMARLNSNGRKTTQKADTRLPDNLRLPVRGQLDTRFGEINDLGAQSRGLTFLARAGAAVTAPLAGVVKFAGAFQNFKRLVIVEHKDGYHSLIAGLGRIDTAVGETLEAGEPVGVAESGNSPRIYYELRHNGKPINPNATIVAQRKQEKS